MMHGSMNIKFIYRVSVLILLYKLETSKHEEIKGISADNLPIKRITSEPFPAHICNKAKEFLVIHLQHK
jgi:hypothetical protein